DTNYLTDIANYLAKFISSLEDENDTPAIPKNATRVNKNLAKIRKWLNSQVIKAHTKKVDDFPEAKKILSEISQSNLWRYDRPNLKELVFEIDLEDSRSINHVVTSFVQVLAVCHYLLERCCFTSIQPVNDKWAFDMFQSLNATGTPLTAIETFKPLVVNTTEQKEESFKQSNARIFFTKVEDLFKGTRTASRKNKLTNDFLASFSTTVDGKAVSSHFSQQRKWLDASYNHFNKKESVDDYEKKCEFVENLGYHAEFYKNVWLDYVGKNNAVINDIVGTNGAELASILMLYLKDSNHKMSITILANFYKEILRGKENSIPEFIEAIKTISAFYTLWRSAQSNSGLDNVYRQFFKGVKDEENGYELLPHTWKAEQQGQFRSAELKRYFSYILKKEGIWDKENWKAKASRELNYKDASKICRNNQCKTANLT
ncbi:MAG: DUF262 domain-containing protein, partial [Bacteroidota bacterium]